MICQRCARDVPNIHSCTPSDFVRKLEAEVAELRKDAERYRWLRSQHWNDSSMCAVMHPKSAVRLGHQCPSDDRLDAAIDASLAKEQS